jgi:hypothetical protein
VSTKLQELKSKVIAVISKTHRDENSFKSAIKSKIVALKSLHAIFDCKLHLQLNEIVDVVMFMAKAQQAGMFVDAFFDWIYIL